MRLTRTHEQIIRLWAKPANLKQLHEVEELAMDVSAYLFHFAITQGTNGDQERQPMKKT